MCVKGALQGPKNGDVIQKTFTNSKSHFFITIYFINHILYLPPTAFHGSLFLSYRDAIFVSRIVIRRMQGFRMSPKGLHVVLAKCVFRTDIEYAFNIYQKTYTAQKMRIKNPQTADLVTFTEEILNGKFHYLCSFTSFCMLVSAIFFKILAIFKTYFKRVS